MELGAAEFLRVLYGEQAPGYLPLWCRQDKRTRWMPADDLKQAVETAIKLSRTMDVYFGLGLHEKALGEGKRGEASGVIALPGFWADIDVKGDAHKSANLPPTVRDALKVLEAIPLSPTLVLHTGHGLQVWWLFRNLWTFDDPDERKEAQDLSRRFQATLQAEAWAHGWRVDGTHDISRVLRMPETYNRKLEPVPVRVLRFDPDNRYDPEDFAPYLRQVTPVEEPEVDSEGNGHDPEGARALLELLRERLSGRILKAIEEGPEAFEPKEGGDGSGSGADAAVCAALIAAGLTDKQVRGIYRTYPIGTRGKYAKRGDAYLAQTLRNERAWLKANGKSREHGPEEEWEQPVPLPEGLPPVAGLDPVLLPEPLRGWIVDISDRMQIPPDFPAAGAITVAGSLVGRKIGIHPKRYDDWLVICNPWGAVVGRPSLLKSPALAEAMKPLSRLIAKAYERYEEERATYEREAMVAEARKAALREEMKKAAKEAAKSGDSSKLEEIALREEPACPEEPTPRRYKTEDPTVEKLSELLLQNPRGMLVHRDELSGWLKNLDKQGRDGDRAFYFESWNGTGSFDVDRISRGSLHIPALCLSVLGGIQPGPLSSYVYGATQGGEGDDGLLQRLQVLVWPDAPKKWRNVDRWPDTQAKNRAYEVFRKLDELTPEKFGATAGAEGDIPAVRFTPEAQEEFDAWRSGLEEKIRSGDLSPALESHPAKYRSLMPSLALLFALVEFVDGSGEAEAVGLKAALQAIAWCDYLESHARRLYASAENPALEGARTLLKRIEDGDVKDGSTLREVYRSRHWSKLATPEEVAAAAKLLEDYGWLRVETFKTGGRPTTRLRLYPALKGAT